MFFFLSTTYPCWLLFSVVRIYHWRWWLFDRGVVIQGLRILKLKGCFTLYFSLTIWYKFKIVQFKRGRGALFCFLGVWAGFGRFGYTLTPNSTRVKRDVNLNCKWKLFLVAMKILLHFLLSFDQSIYSGYFYYMYIYYCKTYKPLMYKSVFRSYKNIWAFGTMVSRTFKIFDQSITLIFSLYTRW